jgi:hypothetical protein
VDGTAAGNREAEARSAIGAVQCVENLIQRGVAVTHPTHRGLEYPAAKSPWKSEQGRKIKDGSPLALDGHAFVQRRCLFRQSQRVFAQPLCTGGDRPDGPLTPSLFDRSYEKASDRGTLEPLVAIGGIVNVDDRVGVAIGARFGAPEIEQGPDPSEPRPFNEGPDPGQRVRAGAVHQAGKSGLNPVVEGVTGGNGGRLFIGPDRLEERISEVTGSSMKVGAF